MNPKQETILFFKINKKDLLYAFRISFCGCYCLEFASNECGYWRIPPKKISFPYSHLIFRSLSFESKFWNNLPQLLSILSKWYLSSCQSLLAFCNVPCLCCKAKRIVFQLKVTLEFYEVTRVQSSCPKTNNSDHSKNSQSTVPYLPVYNTHFFPIKIIVKIAVRIIHGFYCSSSTS